MDELPSHVNYSEMKAELQALRKELEELKTKQAAFKISSPPTVRWKFPKRFIIASIPLAALLVAGVALWGQDAIKALFIDQNGNARFNGTVGINYNPIANQDLVITPKTDDVALNITDPAHTLNRLSVFSNGDVIMNGGNVGIGTTTPTAGKKLDVVGDARVSASLTAGSADVTGSLAAGGDLKLGNSALFFTKTDHDFSGAAVADNAAIENSKNYNALMILGRTISTENPTAEPPTKLKRVVGMWDRVGIGTGNPQAPLDVAGEIRADSLTTTGNINGEKPPLRFAMNSTGSGNWNTVVQDIGDLCGDQDGCSIKLLMHHRTEGRVRTITEEVYIGNPGRTKFNGGLGGYTRQSGGGEIEWQLDTTKTNNLIDTFGWCRADNYIPSGFNLVSVPPGTPSERDKAFQGDNKYRIAFSCHPNVMGEFIIYDR